MNYIETMRDFIASYPKIDLFTNDIHIDWTDSESDNCGLMPIGQTVINRIKDVVGDAITYKQYNFALYARNYTVDDVTRLDNVNFLDDFTQWIEEQSNEGLAPIFGDDPEQETMSAQNGMLFLLSEDGMTGTYQIQISVNYIKIFGRND